MKRFSSRVVQGLVLSAMSFLLAGCGIFSPPDDKTPPPPPPPPYVEPTSPQRVLSNLIVAHVYRDIEGYRTALADDYRFKASPLDPDVEFDTLVREEDIASTENMFNNVDRITMTLTYDEQSPAAPSDVEDLPAELGYVMIVVQNVNLDVTTRDLQQGEPVILRVPGEPAKVIFKQTSVSPRRFAISAIYDQSGSGRMADAMVRL